MWVSIYILLQHKQPKASDEAFRVPSDCSSQPDRMMVSARRDYSVSTGHIQLVFLFVCFYAQAPRSCIKPFCLHTVANRSSAKWCSFLLSFSSVNQYTCIEWCAFRMNTIMLHTICCGQKKLRQAVALICVQTMWTNGTSIIFAQCI